MTQETEEPYDGPERRKTCYRLPDDQLEQIAKRAYELAKEQIYLEVGKGVVRAGAYLVGAALVALAAWLGISQELK